MCSIAKRHLEKSHSSLKQQIAYFKFTGRLIELRVDGSFGNSNGWTLSSDSETSLMSRTWNLFRPLNTISRFRGFWRCRCCWGDRRISVALTWLLILPMPESAEISRCAWKPLRVVELAACLACFVSIVERVLNDGDAIAGPGATTLITGYCGFGRLDVCKVNFETIVVAAWGVGRTLNKHWILSFGPEENSQHKQ